MNRTKIGGIEAARALVGQRFGPFLAWDPVNLPMIRQWCEALGVTSPELLEKYHGSGDDSVAPATMLNVWLMRGVGDSRPAGSAQEEPRQAAEILAAAGYPAVVATACEQEFTRYLRPGDRLTAMVELESISDEKTTTLGVGHFITVRTDYTDHNGEMVGTMRFTTLQYRPADNAAATAPVSAKPSEPVAPPVAVQQHGNNRPSPPQPGISQDTAFFWDGLKEDRLLIQRCSDCKELRHPPGPICTKCHSFEWETVQATGRGTLYSYVVMHHPQLPGFDYPHLVGLVELEEGTRLVAPVVGIAPDAAEVGMPLQVVFEHREGEHRTALFRPAAS